MDTSVSQDYYGNATVTGTYSIRMEDIAIYLHSWLTARGEEKIDGYNKIQSIKHIRECYRYLGLRQAKEAVEYVVEYGWMERICALEEREGLQQEALRIEQRLASVEERLLSLPASGVKHF